MDDDVVLYVNVYQALDFMKKEYGFASEKRDKKLLFNQPKLEFDGIEY